MDKDITKVRIFLITGVVLLIIGFLICTIKPENVFVGVMVIFASCCLFIVSLVPAIRIIRLRNNKIK